MFFHSQTGAVGFLTFADIMNMKRKSMFLFPLLKVLFFLQPVASLAIMYYGYHLLKHVRLALFAPGGPPGSIRAFFDSDAALGGLEGAPEVGPDGTTGTTGGTAGPDGVVRSPSSPGERAAPQQPVQPRRVFAPFDGPGFQLETSSSADDGEKTGPPTMLRGRSSKDGFVTPTGGRMGSPRLGGESAATRTAATGQQLPAGGAVPVGVFSIAGTQKNVGGPDAGRRGSVESSGTTGSTMSGSADQRDPRGGNLVEGSNAGGTFVEAPEPVQEGAGAVGAMQPASAQPASAQPVAAQPASAPERSVEPAAEEQLQRESPEEETERS